MATPGGTPRRTPARRTPARRTLPGSELWQRGVAASDGGAGSRPVTANGAVADTAAAAAQADAPETYEEGHKNPWVAVLLWLVGGIFGWHHLYLGRAVHGMCEGRYCVDLKAAMGQYSYHILFNGGCPRLFDLGFSRILYVRLSHESPYYPSTHGTLLAFTWMISLGGFGIGLLYDLYRMTWYVDEANLHQRVRDAYGMFAATKRRQGCCYFGVDEPNVHCRSYPTCATGDFFFSALFSARTLGQVFFGAILRQITIWAVPQEPEVSGYWCWTQLPPLARSLAFEFRMACRSRWRLPRR